MPRFSSHPSQIPSVERRVEWLVQLTTPPTLEHIKEFCNVDGFCILLRYPGGGSGSGGGDGALDPYRLICSGTRAACRRFRLKYPQIFVGFGDRAVSFEDSKPTTTSSGSNNNNMKPPPDVDKPLVVSLFTFMALLVSYFVYLVYISKHHVGGGDA